MKDKFKNNDNEVKETEEQISETVDKDTEESSENADETVDKDTEESSENIEESEDNLKEDVADNKEEAIDEDIEEGFSPEGATAYGENNMEDESDGKHNLVKKAKKKASDKKEKYSRRFKYIGNFVMNKPFKTSIILSFIMMMFIESMSRRSLGAAVNFAIDKPVIFLLNWLIVLAPFLLSIAVKRKPVIYFLFTVIWAIIGVTDYYMLSFRTTPFTGVDLQISTNEISVALGYLGSDSTKILLSLLLAVLLSIVLWIFSPKSKIRFGRWKSLLILVVSWVTIYFTIIGSIAVGILTTKFGNLGISYHDYGIAYCFTVTIVDTGISEPNDYSEQKISDLVAAEEAKENEKKDLPNIIFIQLESFIDMTDVKGLEMSEDPVPTFRKLRKEYSSGLVTVPTIVAGTCNTEFEAITGMSLEFFGPGEYPYKTILKQTTCESAAFDLKKLGYTAHGIHNHTSGFYGRNEVYASMGFDTFTGIELMHDTSKTANGKWTKDDVLPGCIMDCLESTKTKDYVYTVSVQGHGIYTADLPEEEQHIEVSGIEDADLLKQYNYYVNQTKEMDNFIKDLIEQLSEFDEDVVLVMYGDHIPGLGLADESFKSKDRTIYNTEYVIWDNMGLKKKDADYKMYEMAAEVLDRVDIHEGTIFKYHQNSDHESKEYLKNLKNLQYDMLYGKHYVYNGKTPYEKTNIRYGVKEIKIDKTSFDEDYLYIEGGYFNNYSKVFINGEKYKAELISSTLLKVPLKEDMFESSNELVIRQINSLNVEFKKSKVYKFKYDAVENNENTIDDEDIGDMDEDNVEVKDDVKSEKKLDSNLKDSKESNEKSKNKSDKKTDKED